MVLFFFSVFCYVSRLSFSFFFFIIGKLRDSATGNVLFFFFIIALFSDDRGAFFLFSFSLVYFVNENRGLLITRK